jgi:hypothetical protein
VTAGPEPPAEVRELAGRRADARAGRDFAAADELRARIEQAGWQVRDTPDGYALAPLPPYPVLPNLAALPDRSAEPAVDGCTVAVLVEGWPEDVRRSLGALLDRTPDDVTVTALDLGNVDGAGDALHDLAGAHPDRVTEFHLAGAAGWGPAQAALLRASTGATHVLMDLSTVFDGDALTPLLDALAGAGVVGAGWRGVNVDVDDAWRSVVDAGPGEVDALLGYLAAFSREALLAVGGPHRKARFYRNADLELSLLLREQGGRLVVPAGELPCHAERHRGYHDSDPAYRDRESKQNYDRILRRFRNRTEILAPR